MTAREFFYLVSSMRTAQREYFQTRDRSIFTRCRALENEVDREIQRVKTILAEESQTT